MEMSLNPRGCAVFADATLICLSADWWKQLRRSRRDTFKTLLWLTKIYGRHFLNCSSEEVIFHTRIPQRCTLSYVTLFDAMNLEKCHCNSFPVSDIDTFQWNKTTLGFYYRSWEIILISLKNFNIFYFSRHLIYLELDPQLYYTRFDIFTLFGNYKRFNRLHTGNAIILIAMHLELRNVHWKWISITLISNKSRMTNELLLYVT